MCFATFQKFSPRLLFPTGAFKCRYALVVLCLIGLNRPATAQDAFEAYLQAQRERQEAFERAQEEGLILQAQAYEQFLAEEQARMDAFEAEMMEKWGSFQQPAPERWSQYTQNGNARWEADFEQGDVRVEVVAQAGESETALRERLAGTVQELSQSRGAPTPLPDDEREVSATPVLEDQLERNEAETDQEFAQTAASNAEIRTQTNPQGEEVQILSVNLQLVPDHIRRRAVRFQEDLAHYAETYDIEPALLMALIHTESFFNPTARSHANAHGLMQIVPTSAGRDVYRELNQQDGIPTPEFLYQPAQNMLFGSVYITILRDRYIPGVESTLVHDYMIISAYNTGAGNVARAYTGETGIREAVRVANSMSAEENYNHLVAHLPYEETRDYLAKITERRESYRRWFQGEE
jgi:membrane-bound lytic murein transglycosylase C